MIMFAGEVLVGRREAGKVPFRRSANKTPRQCEKNSFWQKFFRKMLKYGTAVPLIDLERSKNYESASKSTD
jgi:hypothetical protein